MEETQIACGQGGKTWEKKFKNIFTGVDMASVYFLVSKKKKKKKDLPRFLVIHVDLQDQPLRVDPERITS